MGVLGREWLSRSVLEHFRRILDWVGHTVKLDYHHPPMTPTKRNHLYEVFSMKLLKSDGCVVKSFPYVTLPSIEQEIKGNFYRLLTSDLL